MPKTCCQPCKHLSATGKATSEAAATTRSISILTFCSRDGMLQPWLQLAALPSGARANRTKARSCERGPKYLCWTDALCRVSPSGRPAPAECNTAPVKHCLAITIVSLASLPYHLPSLADQGLFGRVAPSSVQQADSCLALRAELHYSAPLLGSNCTPCSHPAKSLKLS